MGKAPDSNIAGPLEIDSEVLERDAQIREINDGKRVSATELAYLDSLVINFVELIKHNKV